MIAGEWTISDVWGPARVKSIGGWLYYISFMDNAKRLGTVLFMKTKSDAFQRIKEYIGVIEAKHGQAPRYMHFDNAPDLVGSEIRSWVANKGIVIEMTMPYSPAQNGIAERFNRALLLAARVTLRRIPPFHLLLRVSLALTLTLALIVGISLIPLIPLAVDFGSIISTRAGFAPGILGSVP